MGPSHRGRSGCRCWGGIRFMLGFFLERTCEVRVGSIAQYDLSEHRVSPSTELH